MKSLSDQLFIEAIKQDQQWNFAEAEQLRRAAFDESANEYTDFSASKAIEKREMDSESEASRSFNLGANLAYFHAVLMGR